MCVDGFDALRGSGLHTLSHGSGLAKHGPVRRQGDVDAYGVAGMIERALAGFVANHGVLHHNGVAALEGQRVASLKVARSADSRTGDAHGGKFYGRSVLVAHNAEHTAALRHGIGHGDEQEEERKDGSVIHLQWRDEGLCCTLFSHTTFAEGHEGQWSL